MDRVLIIALLLTLTCNLRAQTKQVSGEVFDSADGQPIAGATVRIDGTQKATVTNADGKFTFSNLSAKENQITITFIGYEPFKGSLKPDMKIYLTSKPELMDEVIVVAFGKQKRESFTGSATVVSSADIQKQQVSSPLEVLNGRVPGLMMTETNSLASGSDPSIVIRGIGSLNAATDPLIVVDGLPFSGYMSDINPADIENMTVLKDAASNALYGARGANGVIMITTKNASKGKTTVNINAKWGVNSDARVQYDYIDNPGEYYEAYYRAYMNNFVYRQGMSAGEAHIKANNTIGLSADRNGLGYMVYSVPSNQFLIGENGKLNPYATLGNRVAYNNQIYTLLPDNWTKEGTRNGFRQEYNINLSGGNDKYSVMASLGYINNKGIAYGSDMERFTARLKTTYNPFSFLKLGANAGYTHTDSNDMYGVFAVMYTVAPIYPLYIRDGAGNILTDSHGRRYDYGYLDMGVERPVEKEGNPIQDDLLNVTKNSVNAFNMQGYGTFDFLENFHLTVNGSVYITENRTNTAYNPYYGYTINTGGNTGIGHYRTTNLNFQQLLNYNRAFGAHSVDLLIGHEYSRDTQTELEGSTSKIANYEQNKELSGAIILESTSSTKSLYNVEGYFFRGQYDYDNKYFANVSFRRDGSSNFHPKHRWGNFWSVGGAWILTKEDWFPKSAMVNMLKFKASYGEQGNDQIGNLRYTDTYTIKNSNDEISLVFSTKGNPDITWEKVGNFNTGFEFELFNNRLRGGIDYYYRKTRDMLMYFSAPYEMGYEGYYDNVGDMVNQGIEIDLSGDVLVLPNFSWNIGLNLTWERNRVTYLPEEKGLRDIEGYRGYVSGLNFIGEDLPVYTWYTKRYAGVSPNGSALYYKDGADGSLTTTESYDEAGYYLCGNALPDIFGGFSTTFKIFDFDLSAQFNYSIGGKKWDYGYQYLMGAPYTSYTGHGLHRDVMKSWTPDNTSSNLPMWYFGDTNSCPQTDLWLTDASYLTLRNITLGYTLPKHISKKIKMNSLRVFATCENVAYWTKRKGFDPRMSFTQGSYGSNSPMRTISGGVQIEF